MGEGRIKSGKEIGQLYVSRVKCFLETNQELPLAADGTLNVTLLAHLVDIPRQSIYKNSIVRELVVAACARSGVKFISKQQGLKSGDSNESASGAINDVNDVLKAKELLLLERRLAKLEQINAVMVIEVASLRQENIELRAQLGRAEFVVDTGRRVPSPIRNL